MDALQSETLHDSLRFRHVRLRLGPPVEYGAVPRRADNLLVQRPLAPLALRPKPAEDGLLLAQLPRSSEVYARQVPCTVRARRSIARDTAAQAGGLALHKHGQSTSGGRLDAYLPAKRKVPKNQCEILGRNDKPTQGKEFRPGVFPLEEGFWVREDGAEEPGDRVGKVVGEVVVCINGEVVLQDVERVLCILVRLGLFRPLDHDVGHPVSQDWSGAGVPDPHLLCEGNVCLGNQGLVPSLVEGLSSAECVRGKRERTSK